MQFTGTKDSIYEYLYLNGYRLLIYYLQMIRLLKLDGWVAANLNRFGFFSICSQQFFFTNGVPFRSRFMSLSSGTATSLALINPKHNPLPCRPFCWTSQENNIFSFFTKTKPSKAVLCKKKMTGRNPVSLAAVSVHLLLSMEARGA